MSNKATIIAIIIACSFGIAARCSAETKASPVMLRVAIADDKAYVQLSIAGKYSISDIGSNRVLMSGPRLDGKVVSSGEDITIGPRILRSRGIRIKASAGTDISIDSRRFRGEVDILSKENGRLLIINRVDIEYYLYGVLYHEVSHLWPIEALKAQAIASRTFAMYQKRQNASQFYDVRNDVYSQMYGGRTSEKRATTRAVNLTKGKVLIYKGDALPAYFHATCAGHTEDASVLWNTDLAPLKGVRCDYCKDSKHYRWMREIPLSDLEGRLKKSGYSVDDIVSVSVLSRTASGRAEKIEIKDRAGVTVIMTAKEFRQMFGPDAIRSTRFEMKIIDRQIVINGLGWGHGVGMCQWGAFGMACAGKKAEEILGYYYPGSEIMYIDYLSIRR